VSIPGFREHRWAVSPYNFDQGVRAGMHLPASVQVMDMTLREGRQVAGVALRLDDVVEFARRIDAVGVPIIEMHHDLPDEIVEVKKLDLNLKIQALVHPTATLNPVACEKEIDALNDVGADIICLAFAISDYNHALVESMGGLKLTREEALDKACDAVRYGKERGDALISVNLMDFSRLDLDRLRTIVTRLRDAGVDILRIDDICACCIPAVYKHHAWEVKQILGDVPMAIHSHDDFNLAIAGQLSALEGGASILEGCVNGLGERAGVPNLAVLASVLEIMYGFDTGIDLSAMQELSEWVAAVWNQPIPPHMAGVGKTAFSHAAEVHYVLPEDDEWAFNAWSPAVLGNTAYVPTCHYSGQEAFKLKARQLGLGELDSKQANLVLDRVRDELRFRKSELTDEQFATIVREMQ
jgi:2-isopropylmalate synthase